MNSTHWNKILLVLIVLIPKAGYADAQIYNIANQPSVYNFTTHAYSSEQIESGVRFSFNSSVNDTLAVIVDTASNFKNSFKNIDFFGTDSSFTTPAGAKSGNSTIIFPFQANSGSRYYCVVRPSGTSTYNNDFKIHIGTRCTVSVVADGQGTTTPTSAVPTLTWTNLSMSIQARANPTSFFNRWSATDGVSFEDSTEASTNIIPSVTKVSATAHFIPKPVNEITFIRDTFNFQLDGGDSLGVLFKFTAPGPDSFYVTLSRGDDIYYPGFRLTYYKNDSTFSTPDSQTSTQTEFYFRSSEINQSHYFRIQPYYISDAPASFAVKADSFYNLIILPDSIATVTPVDTFLMKSGTSRSIAVSIPDMLHYFDKWQVVSGNALFGDSLSRSTYVYIDSNDVTIRALIKSKSVYEIVANPDTFQYAVHGNRVSGGVLLYFTAPTADSFFLDIKKLTPHSNYIYYYGLDSTYSSSPIRSAYISGTSGTFSFTSLHPNEKHYFRVYPSSTSYDDYQFITQVQTFYTITLQKDFGGFVNTDTTFFIHGGIPQNLPFPKYSGKYYFNHWSLVTGSASFADSTDSLTTIITHANTTVRAVYSPRPVRAISENWDTLSYTDVTGGTRGGILFSFTPEAADSFLVDIRYISSHLNRILNYDTLTSCSSHVNFYTRTMQLSFQTDSGITRHYRVYPQYLADTIATIRVRYFRYHNLTIKKDLAGVLSSDTLSRTIRSNETIVIDTLAVPGKYYFDHWEVISGLASLTNPLKLSDSINIQSDVVVKAVYKERPVQSLGFSWDTLGYQDIEGGTKGGIVFSYTSTASDTFIVALDRYPSLHTKRLFYYGTDASCSTIVWSGYNSSNLEYAFRTTAANQTHYFKVIPYHISDTTLSIRIRLFRYCKVCLIAENGAVDPADTVLVRENGSIAINTWPDPYSYYFTNWQIISGNAAIGNSATQSTNLTVDSVDVIAEAMYQPKTLFPITESDSTYTFTTHGGSAYSGGVIMSFTSPGIDSFSISLNPNNYSIIKTIYYYGTNSSFEFPIDSATGITNQFMFFASSADQKHYFRIAPKTFSQDRDPYGFKIRYRNINYISFLAGAGGMVNPNGAVPAPDSIPVTDTARPASALYYFDRWVRISGNLWYSSGDSTDSIISVAAASGDASIRAEFIRKEIHSLTNADSNYTFNIHGFPKGGVLLSYTTSSADSHALVINLPSSYFYNIDFFDTASTFTNIVDSVRNKSDINYRFKFESSKAGATYYFRINPSNNADYNTKSFNIRVDTTVLLQITRDSGGTTAPLDSLRFIKGGTINLSATATNIQCRFKVWRTLSGSQGISITDSISPTTSITAISDARIHAVFEQKPVHLISFTLDTLCYAKDGAPQNSGGILMKFVAPARDSFVISFSSAGYYSKVINFYHYGTASTFVGVRGEQLYTSDNMQYGFKTNSAGETHYFRVEPYYNYDYNDSIAVRVLGFSTVELVTNGRGRTDPPGSIRVLQTRPYNIKAEPASNYYQFWKWTVLNGKVHLADTTAFQTTLQILDTGDARIQANFDTYGINLIPKTPQHALYHYDSSIPPGLFCKFTSEKVDSFLLYVKHYNSSFQKSITFFGTHSHYAEASAIKSYPIRSLSDTLFRFKTEAPNADHYFRISPINSYDDSLTIMWIPYLTLRVTSDGGGNVTPVAPVSKIADDTVHITTTAIDPLFTFYKWTITEGSATIADSLSASTWVRLNGQGDATIKAIYSLKAHDTLYVEDDSNGITVPLGMVLVDTTKDTLVTAYSNSHWLFDKWTISNGNPTISNANNMVTRVKLDGTAQIRACFKPNPNAKPSLVINSITVQNHPEIDLVATLRDRSGKAISNTDSVEFLLMQDSSHPSFSVTTLSDIRGVSVSLVIDRSKTMSVNSRIDSALVAAKNFVNAMTPLDRASIISFSSGPRVEQTITSDKDLLKNGLNKITTDDGETAIIDGAYSGVEQLVSESNTRAVIIFSDGFENASVEHNLQSVISYASKNGVMIYSIAVGAEAFTEVDASLRPLADSTGGYFFFARNTSELSELYQHIKSDIESRYLIRYDSPDKIINGDTHSVILSTTLSATLVSDTGYWIETGRAPEIKLKPQTIDLIENQQPSAESLPITVWITDDESPVPVRNIFYRRVGSDNAFTEDSMWNLSDSTFSFLIPADSVNKPGIEFSITATDRHGLTATVGPFQINIDNDGPQIAHTPPNFLKANQDLQLKAVVRDPDEVAHVLIYYRNSGTADFLCDTMSASANDTFLVTLDGTCIFGDYLEYYIQAKDKYLALSRNPSSTNYKVNVDQPPKLTYKGLKVWNEGDSVTGEFIAEDPEGGQLSLILISKLPENAFCDLISPDKIRLRWKTGTRSNGDYRFIFSVSDQSYTVTDTIILTINDLNLPPEVIAPSICNVTEGDTIGLMVFGIDPDKNIIQFTIESLPSEALRLISIPSETDTAKAQIFWATGSNDAGVYELIISASDGTNSVLDTVTIVVKDSSFFVPVVHATTVDTLIASGKEVVISVWATDDDQSIPSLQLSGLPEGATFKKNARGDSGLFVWTASGLSELVLTAIAYDKVDVNQSDTLYIKLSIAQYLATAALQDTNGNGFLDRICFTWEVNACLKDSLPQPGEWIDSISIRLLDSTYQKLDPIRIIRFDSISAYVLLNEKTEVLQTGYDSALISLLSYPVTKRALPTSLFSVKDLAGPVIKKAIYHPGVRELNDKKKLTVYFSEPILWPQVETHPADFLSYFHDSEIDKAIFTSLDAVNTSSMDSVVIYLDYEAQVSVFKDSLSLLPFSTDNRSHLCDTTKWRNLPHKHNRKVPLVLDSVPVNLIATVCDTNGEGHIDKIILTLPAEYSLPATLPKVNAAITSITVHPWKEDSERNLKPVKLEKSLNSRKLIITIEENSSAGLETGWYSFNILFASIFVSAEKMPFKLSEVKDSAGPVISRTISYSVSLTAQNQYDTLEVQFSEPVLWTQKYPLQSKLFNFFTKDRAGRKILPFEGLSHNSIINSDSISIKMVMDNGFRFKPNSDSLNISLDTKKFTTEITDYSKIWPHAANRKVQIEYRAHENFSVSICPNPYSPSTQQDNGLGTPGIAIIVECDTVASQYTGNVTIFDAIGNTVLRNKKMHQGVSNDLWLSYVWDAKDEDRHDVGRGVYYVKIELTNNTNGKRVSYGEKVGVMRVPRR